MTISIIAYPMSFLSTYGKLLSEYSTEMLNQSFPMVWITEKSSPPDGKYESKPWLCKSHCHLQWNVGALLQTTIKRSRYEMTTTSISNTFKIRISSFWRKNSCYWFLRLQRHSSHWYHSLAVYSKRCVIL